MACGLPVDSGVPLSRWSSAELAREAITRGIVEQISGVTVWRWLSQDAIKPWQHRSWMFPRDPLFAQRAGPILDLYAGSWQGERLHPGDYVVCADEKPSIQARKRKARTHPARRGEGQRVEHEYERKGALCYLAAWDARRAKIFDRCATKDGIEPFDQLVDQFMSQHPYRRAQRVFLVIDNDLDTLQQHLLAFGRRYEQIAAPFQWKFTRQDLHNLLAKTDTQPASIAA